MYDTWFVTGVAIMQHPKLTDTIAPTATFHIVTSRIVVDIDEPKQFPRRCPSAGLLPKPDSGNPQDNATSRVRTALAQFIKGMPGAPPVGIYCAGRFSQYLAIPEFLSKSGIKFTDILTLCHGAFTTALGAKQPKSDRFPAFLGLLLMDGFYRSALMAGTAEAMQVAAEFGTQVGDDLDVAKAFIQDPDFRKAADLFMGSSDLNPWSDGGPTMEQLFFWPGKTEYAIP